MAKKTKSYYNTNKFGIINAGPYSGLTLSEATDLNKSQNDDYNNQRYSNYLESEAEKGSNAVEGVSLGIKDKLNERIYKSIDPFGYSTGFFNKAKAGMQLLSGRQSKSPELDRDPFGYALGVLGPNDMNSWEKSPYGENSIRPKRDFYSHEKISDAIENHLRNKSTGSKNADYFNSKTYDPIVKHDLSFGNDSIGDYMAIHDKWDLGSKFANSLLTRTPDVDDRFYYQEKEFIPKSERPDAPSDLKLARENHKILYDKVNNRVDQYRNSIDSTSRSMRNRNLLQNLKSYQDINSFRNDEREYRNKFRKKLDESGRAVNILENKYNLHDGKYNIRIK